MSAALLCALFASTCALLVFIDPVALRVDYGATIPRAFSYSRVQLWWWTLIIAGSFIAAFGDSGQLPAWNETCLALLGVGGTTAAMAMIVDRPPGFVPAPPPSPPLATTASPANSSTTLTSGKASDHQNFLLDILSDEQGITVSRFQAVVFNFTYGVAFVAQVITSLRSNAAFAFPEFDGESLALLGISSSTYLALKLKEKP